MIGLKDKQNIIDYGLYTLIAIGLSMSTLALISTVKLNNEISAYKTDLASFNTTVNHQKEQVTVFITDIQAINKEVKALSSTTKSLNKRLEEVQQYQLDQTLRESKSSDEKVTTEDISNLQNQLTTVQFQINSANQKIYELNKQAITNTVSKQANSTAQTSALKPVVRSLTPTFVILGIESRGGELFVSVAPSKNAKLNQMLLMREGDVYRGWQLNSIKTNAAVFMVNGRRQIINIR